MEMRFNGMRKDRCDVLVIGGGGAALRAAVAAQERGADTLVVSKGRVGYGNNTFLSKATIAATGFGNPEDGSYVHEMDTCEGGRFLNDLAMVRTVARRIPEEIGFLRKSGVEFETLGERLRVIRIPGHTHPRHVSVKGREGGDLILPLKTLAKTRGVRFIDQVFVSRIVTSADGVNGACGFDAAGNFRVIETGCVVLATGGYGRIYLNNNNAPGMTGDGHILAFEAGLGLKDMEFVQFHPTATGQHGSRMLFYEGLVFHGGAILENTEGENILQKYGLEDPRMATRDRICRVVMQEISEGRGENGAVIMDLGALAEAMPAPLRPLLPRSWTPQQRRLRVAPTTHFCMGGVITDANAATSLPGLYAAGEICGGVHGANRLGGNALAEVFVMGAQAGNAAAMRAGEIKTASLSESTAETEMARLEGLGIGKKMRAHECAARLKRAIRRHGAVVRNEAGLQKALSVIEGLKAEETAISVETPRDLRSYLEFRNMRLVAEMVCRAALMRRESRGAHFRSDYPEEDQSNWRKSIVIKKSDHGIGLYPVPVDQPWS
jgi:succinate dehydrogenase/fumarate reductase flavoprotein subunit